jgi:O-antigen ligase
MLWLAATYLQAGRIPDTTSPEAVIGAIAILMTLVTTLLFDTRRPRPAPDVTAWFLGLFLFAAILGEVVRPDLRPGNVSTLLSIGAYYLVGVAIGRIVAMRDGRLPMLRGLLSIYTVWYLGIAFFLASGDLGFFGVLPETGLRRLEFREGFTATELPIYVGLHFPILLYTIFVARSPLLRLWAFMLVLCAATLVAATVSAAALTGLGLVLLLFLVARWRTRQNATISPFAVLAGIGTLAVACGVAWMTLGPILGSVGSKLQDMSVGESARGKAYGQLIHDIATHPFGIGKGRFVETNDFSWLGEGIYPHHNLLGIGAELGIPAMALFGAFVLAAVVALGRRALSGSARYSRHLRMLATAVLAIFVYQQFRGLFQDTWGVREAYLWLGLGIGTILTRSTRPGTAAPEAGSAHTR